MIRICELGLYSKVICVTSRYFGLFSDYNVAALAARAAACRRIELRDGHPVEDGLDRGQLAV